MGKVARLRPKAVRVTAPPGQQFKLRVAGAYQPREDGFVGIDSILGEHGSVDHLVDLKQMPWPIDDGAVDQVFCGFYFHRLTKEERWSFMDEVCRILKPGGQVALVVPHWSSQRAITDPLAQWPPLCEASFMVYCKNWRKQEQMEELPLSCDFAGEYGYGFDYVPQFKDEMIGRNDEYIQMRKDKGAKELNTITDLHITLTKAMGDV